MTGLEEAETLWRYQVQDADKFERFHVKKLDKNVKITLGRIKNSKRWEIQNYIFEKQTFRTPEQVRKWLDWHLKAEIRHLLDFRAWDERKRRYVNAYVQISKIC